MIHADKITTIQNADFRNKVAEAALQRAKVILLTPPAGVTKSEKLFAQEVLKTIAKGNPDWLDGLSYFTLSTPVTEAYTPAQVISAPQAAVTDAVNVVFVFFAKAQQSDVG